MIQFESQSVFPTPDPERLIGSRSKPLSVSQVTTYLDCSARWHYKSRLGLPDPPSPALTTGRVVHLAAANQLEAKMAGATLGAEFVEAEIIEPAFEAAWAEQQQGSYAEGAKALDEVKGLYRVWHEEILPMIQPAYVEHTITGNIGGIYLTGVVDVIEADGTIRDLKTAGAKPSEIKYSNRLQLTSYARILHAERFAVDTLTKTKTPKAYTMRDEMTEADAIHLISIFPTVADAMNRGSVLPNRSSNLCSRKNCPFWASCQQDYGGEVKSGESKP